MGQLLGKNGSQQKALKNEKANIDEADGRNDVTGQTNGVDVDKSATNADKPIADVDKSQSDVDKSNSIVDKPISDVDESTCDADKSASYVDESPSVVDKSISVVDKPLLDVENMTYNVDKTVSVVDKYLSEKSNETSKAELDIPNKCSDSENKNGIRESDNDVSKIPEDSVVSEKSDQFNEFIQTGKSESNNLSEKILPSEFAVKPTSVPTNGTGKTVPSDNDPLSDTNGHHNTTSSEVDRKSLSGRSENSESEEVTRSDTSGDVFKEVNKELTSIKKSRSRSDILVHQKLEKSASR